MVFMCHRWWFGDGGNRTHQIKPPYDNSSNNQVVICDDVEYVYAQPGKKIYILCIHIDFIQIFICIDYFFICILIFLLIFLAGEYTLLFSASNRYENKTCKVDVYVFSILTSVRIEIDPPLLLTEKPADFEAHPLPSPYGIIYTWNFGDNSSVQQGRERRVPHAYAHSGVYNICVNVNNTISWTDTCMEVIVYEDVKGLEVMSSAPTECNTPTVVTASLEAGNNVTWSFDMGDGTVHTGMEPKVEYTYRKDGNYTVNVTAKNAVSSQWVIIPVEVFVLQVLSLEPPGCIQENKEVLFHAFVSGNASGHQYVWSFGDRSPNETQYGTPMITHTYVKSGEYNLSLLMSSEANKANFFRRVCVQPELTTVSLFPLRTHIKLSEESRFTVAAFPEFNYTYLWDLGYLTREVLFEVVRRWPLHSRVLGNIWLRLLHSTTSPVSTTLF